MARTLSQGEPICSGGINFLSEPSVLTHRVLHGVEARIFVISLYQSKDIPVKLKEGFFFLQVSAVQAHCCHQSCHPQIKVGTMA